MEQQLFSELRTLYSLSWGKSNVIRLRIRMRDLVDSDSLRYAVETTMNRYPYFCVELKKAEEYYFAQNDRPVVITNSLSGVELNTAESNYHLVSFSWMDNWIIMDISHAITDGTGAYEVLRTLLFYYVSSRYGVKLEEDGIRLVGDDICIEEWEDPVLKAQNLPVPPRTEMSDALNVVSTAGLENDKIPTVYSIAIPEDEFMRFNIQNDGSPATMVSLFLSRSIAKMYPDSEDVIRIAMTVNQRNALRAPLAHQTLVGGVMLEYKEKLRSWPLDRQATAYRGMVFAQTRDEAVLASVASQKGIGQMILSKESDQERAAIAQMIGDMAGKILTATVSYVGKANYKEAEEYIRDFRTWTNGSANFILIEIAAVNGRFTLDFLQPFKSPLYVNAFLKELEDNDITYDLQDVMNLEMPDVKLPWR
jgi:hypothetical protein